MSLTKLYKPSETALRQLFNCQLFRICVLSSNGKMAPNSAVSHEIPGGLGILLQPGSRMSHLSVIAFRYREQIKCKKQLKFIIKSQVVLE